MNAIVLPSGDQAKADTAVSAFVSGTASPPSGRMAKIWFLSPTRLERNASHCPSGDQRGLPEDFSPRVSWVVSPVAALAIQICETKASCLKSGAVTV